MMSLCIGDIYKGPVVSPPGYLASFADGKSLFQHLFATERGIVVVSLSSSGVSVTYHDSSTLQHIEDDVLVAKIPYCAKMETRWRAYNALTLAAKQMKFDLGTNFTRSVSSERGHTSR